MNVQKAILSHRAISSRRFVHLFIYKKNMKCISINLIHHNNKHTLKANFITLIRRSQNETTSRNLVELRKSISD